MKKFSKKQIDMLSILTGLQQKDIIKKAEELSGILEAEKKLISGIHKYSENKNHDDEIIVIEFCEMVAITKRLDKNKLVKWLELQAAGNKKSYLSMIFMDVLLN